jgi:glycosyltransferase involved in cell wall biosynthesis
MKSRPAFRNVGPPHAGKCRLLYVVGQLHTGGLERQLVYLLRALDRDRYRPVVAVWLYDENDVRVREVRDLGVPIYAMSGPASGLEKLRAFRRLARELMPEVIHSYSFFTNLGAAWAASAAGAVAVGSIRSDFVWGKRDAGPVLGRASARWPGHQISNSYTAANDAARSRSMFKPRRCDVVWNGLDLTAFRPAARTDAQPHIVGLGYLLPVKRWDRLLDVAATLTRRGLGFTVEIVGDGPLRPALEDQARRLGIADRVELAPHTNDVAGKLARSSFLVLTSANEGTPNVVMEAMACGRAVVATAVGDVPYLVKDGLTGFVVRPDDDAALLGRIATLLTDADLCERMGRAARTAAEQMFDLERLGTETLASYRAAGWLDTSGPVSVSRGRSYSSVPPGTVA